MTMLNGEPIGDPAGPRYKPIEVQAAPTASAQSQQVGFVMGLMSLILAFALPIAGAIIGGISLNQAKQGGYRNPLAKAGLILGIVFTVLIVLIVVLSIFFSVSFFTEMVGLCQGAPEGTLWGIPYSCT